jgi:HNH endonuclease
MNKVKRIALFDPESYEKKEEIIVLAHFFVFLKKYDANPAVIFSFIYDIDYTRFRDEYLQTGYKLMDVAAKIKYLRLPEEKLYQPKIRQLITAYALKAEIEFYIESHGYESLFEMVKLLINLEELHSNLGFREKLLPFNTKVNYDDYCLRFQRFMYQIPKTLKAIENIRNSRDNPQRLYWLGKIVWFYNERIYEVNSIYDETEARLLVISEFDKERRKFENLNVKFSSEDSDIVSKREKIPEKTRIEVWRRDGGKCVKCSSREKLEYDHIIPVSRGGSNTSRNIELLCESCNRSKGSNIA